MAVWVKVDPSSMWAAEEDSWQEEQPPKDKKSAGAWQEDKKTGGQWQQDKSTGGRWQEQSEWQGSSWSADQSEQRGQPWARWTARDGEEPPARSRGGRRWSRERKAAARAEASKTPSRFGPHHEQAAKRKAEAGTAAGGGTPPPPRGSVSLLPREKARPAQATGRAGAGTGVAKHSEVPAPKTPPTPPTWRAEAGTGGTATQEEQAQRLERLLDRLEAATATTTSAASGVPCPDTRHAPSPSVAELLQQGKFGQPGTGMGPGPGASILIPPVGPAGVCSPGMAPVIMLPSVQQQYPQFLQPQFPWAYPPGIHQVFYQQMPQRGGSSTDQDSTATSAAGKGLGKQLRGQGLNLQRLLLEQANRRAAAVAAARQQVAARQTAGGVIEL
jgi:hypothetical protein